MIQSLLSRVLPAPESPSADLYFVNACADFLGAGVTRLSPTVFDTGRVCLVIRHGLGAPHPPRGRRLIYLVDDEVGRGVSDPSLPFLYRQKLRLRERSAGQRILPMASLAVVSSPEIARHCAPGLPTRLIHPYWSEPIAGQRHFRPLVDDDRGWVEIAYLGSSVHRADLDFLWPVLGALLAEDPRVRFHLAERHRVPGSLSGHPRIRRIPGRGWAAYRQGLSERRFHLALYPLLDTPFNRARSVNKLIEHAVVGAAGLYSKTWPEAWRAADAGAGLVLDNRPGDWLAALRHLLAHPREMRDLASAGAELALRLNQPGAQRLLWAELMEVGADAAG